MKTLGEFLSFILFVVLLVLVVWAETKQTPSVFVASNWGKVVIEKADVLGAHLFYCLGSDGKVGGVTVYQITFDKYAVGDTIR